MRKLLLFLAFLINESSFSQSVHLDIDILISDTSDCEIIVWNMDWQNKIIYNNPTYIDFTERKSFLSFYPGDYAVEYRIDGVACLIYNIHIYPRGCYYRYSIYIKYPIESLIRDRISVNSTYVDF